MSSDDAQEPGGTGEVVGYAVYMLHAVSGPILLTRIHAEVGDAMRELRGQVHPNKRLQVHLLKLTALGPPDVDKGMVLCNVLCVASLHRPNDPWERMDEPTPFDMHLNVPASHWPALTATSSA